MVVIQRGTDDVELLSETDALEILLANTEDAYGFPPYHHDRGVPPRLVGAEPAEPRAPDHRQRARGRPGGAADQGRA